MQFQQVTSTNSHSLGADPNFVAIPGADGILGYSNATNDGRDDDFHVKSLYDSFHSGSFAPVATASGTGAPALLSGTWITDAVQSPAIDSGNPSDAFVNEPAPNGNAINIGAYGNTEHASKSPAAYLIVRGPDGGETWVKGQQGFIRWSVNDLNAPGVTYSIDLMQQGNPTPVFNIAPAAPGTGFYAWTIPNSIVAATDYLVRVTRNDASGLVDSSNAVFAIAEPTSVFYVNDGVVEAGDWTTAVGNDSNDGLTPVTPKATIQGVLAAYDLNLGNRIRIDAGNYTLATNIVIGAQDSGVILEGFHDIAFPTRKTVINRNSISNRAIELQDADDVRIEYLEITGAGTGVYASATSDSDRLAIANSRFIANTIGVQLEATNDQATIGSSFFDGGATYARGIISVQAD